MNENYDFLIGKGEKNTKLLAKMSTRHGLIAGATGTGKTTTLKVMAENFSDIGVPVFLADVKGDIASISEKGETNEKIEERLAKLGIKDFTFNSYPTRLWDVFGELGHPLRTTISEMGPLLLSRILNLNEVQEGVLSITFRLADDLEMLLIDLKDLRSMLIYVGQNAKDLSLEYGNVSVQSVGAIQRSLLTLEDQGGDLFFGEPHLDIEDFLTVDKDNRGMINILAAEKLFHSKKLYSTFLLWMLSELYEKLPEVGDLEKPKLVFFFDEAHILFEDTPRILMEKIEQVVRLIRSKGVGVFFITQNPIDIPDTILGQLGNRVQHALRSFTPREQKAVNAAADTFRQNPNFEVKEVIGQLKTGEALVSFLDEEGKPSIVEQAVILPPKSKFGTISDQQRLFLINSSPMFQKYNTSIDRESAYEILEAQKQALKAEEENLQLEKEKLEREKTLTKIEVEKQKLEAAKQKALDKEAREQEKIEKAHQRAKEKARKNNPLNKVARTTMNTFTGDIGRKIARGILGTFKNKF